MIAEKCKLFFVSSSFLLPYMALFYFPVGVNMLMPFADVTVLMQPCVVFYDMTTVM